MGQTAEEPDFDALKHDATIAVVEDDDAGRESLHAWLISNGFNATIYASAEEFLAQSNLDAPGCVITDYKMPGISGTDLQSELTKLDVVLPVIVVSGYADIPVTVRAMRQGAVTLLEKPFDNTELLRALEEALRKNFRSRRQRQAASTVQENIATLNDAQREIMRLLVAGQPNKTVANQLDLGLRTVERHRQQIFQKMHVESLPELATLLAQAE